MLSLKEVLDRDLDYILAKAAGELEQLAGRHVWFTGGAGFLGYYATLAVHHWNRTQPAGKAIHLTILDNFIRGVPEWLNDVAGGAIQPIRHDVTHPLPEDLPPAAYIIHGASIASPTYYRRYPLETIDANVNGLRIMLDHARERTALQGMLFFSTSEIYGDPPAADIPTPETFRGLVSSTGPRACYDESKRLGETLCVTFAQQFGVRVAMARPFNNYGPGLKITDGRVIADFARNVLDGRDIVMLSDGSPRRTFCYVADAVAGYYKILVKGRPGEPYNIGVETPEISVADLAERVVVLAREMFGYKGRVIRRASGDTQYLVDNPNRRSPIIEKARTELGYRPRVGIDEGLRRSLAWYAGNREASEA